MERVVRQWVCAALAAAGLTCAAAEGPTAEQILAMVRYSQTANQLDLTGSLRKERARHRFALSLNGPEIRFGFADPAEQIVLVLGEEEAVLRAGSGGKEPAEVEAEAYGDAIRGTDITYEDIAFRFLYWPRPELLGEDVVRPDRLTWKVRVSNPKRTGPYGHVLVWVDQVSGALLQIHGFDDGGRLIKRFNVVSGQRVSLSPEKGSEKAWMLKELRVEKVDPTTGRRVGEYTYLNIDKPKA